MGIKKKDVYPGNPEDVNRPLSKTEIRKILDAKGSGFLKDKRKVMQFVERVLVTIEDATRRQRALDHANMELRAQVATKSEYASSMDPARAIQYLDPATLLQHANVAARTVADRAVAEKKEAEGRLLDTHIEVLNLLETRQLDPSLESALRAILKLLNS